MDNNGTFNLPNTDHNALVYRADDNIGNYWNGAIPNITGGFRWCNAQDSWGAFGLGAFGGSYGQGTWHGDWYGTNFDASRISPIYQNNASSVHPRSLNVYMVIKYI